MERVLGLGSAYGDEFEPILNWLKEITILEPSDLFTQKGEIKGVPVNYQKPTVNGQIMFPDNYFDLVSCLGSLHHIPNVSYLISECYRVLKIGGVMLLREPIVSMGDWRQPRQGLTKHERGIPLKVFRSIISRMGFKLLRESFCVFRPVAIIASKLGFAAYNNTFLTILDRLLCKAFAWNYSYHRVSFLSKLAPASVFYVLKK